MVKIGVQTKTFIQSYNLKIQANGALPASERSNSRCLLSHTSPVAWLGRTSENKKCGVPEVLRLQWPVFESPISARIGPMVCGYAVLVRKAVKNVSCPLATRKKEKESGEKLCTACEETKRGSSVCLLFRFLLTCFLYFWLFRLVRSTQWHIHSIASPISSWDATLCCHIWRPLVWRGHCHIRLYFLM